MSRFVDLYLPDAVPGYPVLASPRWSTEIVSVDSGDEQVNQRWAHPLYRYTLPEAVRTMDVFNAVRDHWLIVAGPARAFPFRDPLDFASVPLVTPARTPTTSPTDQVLGLGDGFTRSFQLRKTYTRGGFSYARTIRLPVVSSIRVWRDRHFDSVSGQWVEAGEMSGGFSVERTSGIVTFETPPAAGATLKWGGLFDVAVRFESDDAFDGILRTFGLGGFADLTLIEKRI